MTVVLSDLRNLQTEPAPLVCIARCRAGGVADAVECAWIQSEKDGGVDGLRGPQVSAGRTDIIGGNEPVHTDLFFETEVPLGDLHVPCVVVHGSYYLVQRP